MYKTIAIYLIKKFIAFTCMLNMFQKVNLLKPEWNTNRSLLIYWILLLVLLFIGSFMPLSTIVHHFFMIDTLLHLILYSVLSFIPMILFKSRKNAFLLSLAMTPIGYLFETMHTFVTEENFSAINVLANNIGVLAGIATGFIVRLKCHFSHE